MTQEQRGFIPIFFIDTTIQLLHTKQPLKSFDQTTKYSESGLQSNTVTRHKTKQQNTAVRSVSNKTLPSSLSPTKHILPLCLQQNAAFLSISNKTKLYPTRCNDDEAKVMMKIEVDLMKIEVDLMKIKPMMNIESQNFKLLGSNRSHIGRSPYKQTIGRSSNTSSLHGICNHKKYIGLSWSNSNTKDGSGGPSYYFLHKKNKLSGHIVSRSGVAGTGSPDAAFSLSESQSRRNLRGICFYAVTAISAIFLFVMMLVVHPFVLLFDQYRRKAHHLIAKIWATLTVIPFYDVKIEGLENLPSPDTPAVYVSNHQSFLDIYTLLMLGRNFKFISKTAIFLIPVIGWAMYLLGTIPLKRMDSRSQLETLKRCINLVKKGASVFFFPEGTRSKDGKLGPFKKGAFSIAAKTNVPVVPITLIGTGKIMPAGMEGVVNSGAVKVVIHKPIEGSDPEKLCNEARNIISVVLNS